MRAKGKRRTSLAQSASHSTYRAHVLYLPNYPKTYMPTSRHPHCGQGLVVSDQALVAGTQTLVTGGQGLTANSSRAPRPSQAEDDTTRLDHTPRERNVKPPEPLGQ